MHTHGKVLPSSLVSDTLIWILVLTDSHIPCLAWLGTLTGLGHAHTEKLGKVGYMYSKGVAPTTVSNNRSLRGLLCTAIRHRGQLVSGGGSLSMSTHLLQAAVVATICTHCQCSQWDQWMFYQFWVWLLWGRLCWFPIGPRPWSLTWLWPYQEYTFTQRFLGSLVIANFFCCIHKYHFFFFYRKKEEKINEINVKVRFKDTYFSYNPISLHISAWVLLSPFLTD